MGYLKSHCTNTRLVLIWVHFSYWIQIWQWKFESLLPIFRVFFFYKYRSIFHNFQMFAWQTPENFQNLWKMDLFGGYFCKNETYVKGFLVKSDPLEQHIPICLNMWAPPCCVAEKNWHAWFSSKSFKGYFKNDWTKSILVWNAFIMVNPDTSMTIWILKNFNLSFCIWHPGEVKSWGHSPEKVVWVCPAVKTPFTCLSRHSLDPQLQHDSIL